MNYNLLPWLFDSKMKLINNSVEWLTHALVNIVKPMTLRLKETMKNFQVVNEAELFCSEMEFRVEEKGITQKVIGDGSKNSSDV